MSIWTSISPAMEIWLPRRQHVRRNDRFALRGDQMLNQTAANEAASTRDQNCLGSYFGHRNSHRNFANAVSGSDDCAVPSNSPALSDLAAECERCVSMRAFFMRAYARQLEALQGFSTYPHDGFLDGQVNRNTDRERK